RVPLLDSSLVAFSWRLPDAWLRQGGHGKRILRSMLARSLPAEVVTRRKRGFEVPISAWLRDGLRGWAEELIADARDVPGLDQDQLRQSFLAHVGGRAD